MPYKKIKNHQVLLKALMAATLVISTTFCASQAEKKPQINTLQKAAILLNHQDPQARKKIAHILANFSGDRAKYYPLVKEALSREKDISVLPDLLKATGTLSVGTQYQKEGLEILSKYLFHKEASLRKTAALTLFMNGDSARSARKSLTSCLKKEKDDRIRTYCAYTLASFEWEFDLAVPAILKTFQYNDMMRPNVNAVKAMGAKADPYYKKSLRNKDYLVVIYAMVIIQTKPQLAETCLKEFIRLLSHKHKDVRSFAVRSIGALGNKAKATLPRLIKMRKDSSKDVKTEVEKAIIKIQ